MMKAYRFMKVIAFFQATSLAVITGCEYDVAEPLWYQDYQEPPTPVITYIEPEQAAPPGVNVISIHGENFSGMPDSNVVYFDKVLAEVIESSSIMLKVRRPNIFSDSCTVKVVSKQALLVAKYGPYRIDPVLDRYGAFVENLALSVLAVDPDENLYVVETFKTIHKVTPDGDKTVLGTATRMPYDASIGPDGNLYLTENNRAIDVVDQATGRVSRWTRLPAGKVVKFGDFDANGYFYTGGSRSDLVVVHPDLSVTYAGFYAAEEIFAVRVFNGLVYVASRTYGSQDPVKIWKHLLDENGNVGEQELVFDMSTAGIFSTRSVTAITVASDGTLFIATDSTDPILILNPETGPADLFYKDILPSYCKYFAWGSGDHLYMITGDTNAGEEWTVYRVDMGTTSAQK